MTQEIASPLDSFVAKLERRLLLPPDVRKDFLRLPATIIQAHTSDVVIEERAESRKCLFVASGFVSRQKRIVGRRHIIAFGIAGDAVDLQSLWFQRQDHSVVAHEDTTLVAIEHRDIIELCERYPHATKALWHDSLVDAAIFREWTLNIAHRRAPLRIAHLFLESAARQRAHGLVSDDICHLPCIQRDLANALGLSLVHYNKSLAALRAEGYVKTRGGVIQLLDRPALERASGFDPTYLHISEEPRFEADRASAGS